MKITVNGVDKEFAKGTKLRDAIKGEDYVQGALVAISLSEEKLIRDSNDYEIITDRGSMVIHLDDSEDARLWRDLMDSVKGITSRWVTSEIMAFGSFPTNIETDRAESRRRKYDCFFSLGGFDNHTTYMMIARKDHFGSYGTGSGRIGRITRGRHLLDVIREGESIKDIRPVTVQINSDNTFVTKDPNYILEDGYKVDTNILIRLNENSPSSSEQILIVGSKGYLNVTDSTGSCMGSTDDTDVDIPAEENAVRDRGSVTVRNTGQGNGHIFIYRERRQLVPAHNSAGYVLRGQALADNARAGDMVTVATEPRRALAVGMTQSAGAKYLEDMGIKQKRTGDLSDGAIIVEQIPESTMDAVRMGEAETFAVPREKVLRISLDRKDGRTARYFEKVTGLSHKKVGTLKTQFAFPGMPMITFYGDEPRAKTLYPQDPFKKCKKGDIGVTNQSRPHHGLIGIRLEDSKEYGPTGEEPYGTNLVGRFLDDISKLAETDEEETIYITEEEL